MNVLQQSQPWLRLCLWRCECSVDSVLPLARTCIVTFFCMWTAREDDPKSTFCFAATCYWVTGMMMQDSTLFLPFAKWGLALIQVNLVQFTSSHSEGAQCASIGLTFKVAANRILGIKYKGPLKSLIMFPGWDPKDLLYKWKVFSLLRPPSLLKIHFGRSDPSPNPPEQILESSPAAGRKKWENLAQLTCQTIVATICITQ